MTRYLILLVFAMGCFGCDRKEYNAPNTAVKPENAFRLFAGIKAPSSVPHGVTDLQANGAAWMDFTVCCRFTATTEIIDSIISKGYEKIEWETIQPEMFPKPYITEFSPKWDPAAIKSKECYRKKIVGKNSVNVLSLVIDRQLCQVYAVGESSVR